MQKNIVRTFGLSFHFYVNSLLCRRKKPTLQRPKETNVCSLFTFRINNCPPIWIRQFLQRQNNGWSHRCSICRQLFFITFTCVCRKSPICSHGKIRPWNNTNKEFVVFRLHVSCSGFRQHYEWISAWDFSRKGDISYRVPFPMKIYTVSYLLVRSWAENDDFTIWLAIIINGM